MVWSNEQRAFVVETYFSQSHSIVAVQRAFRTRYQIPPRDRVPDRKSILLWVENFRETGSVWKKMRTITDLSNTREHRGCQTVRFAVSQALCTQTPRKQRPPLARYSFRTMWFKTSNIVVSESKNKIFVSRIDFLLFTLKFTEVILPHPVLLNTCEGKDFSLLHQIRQLRLLRSSPLKKLLPSSVSNWSLIRDSGQWCRPIISLPVTKCSNCCCCTTKEYQLQVFEKSAGKRMRFEVGRMKWANWDME